MRAETSYNQYVVQNTYWFTSNGDVIIVSIYSSKEVAGCS